MGAFLIWLKTLLSPRKCAKCGAPDPVPNRVCDGKIWGWLCLKCWHYGNTARRILVDKEGVAYLPTRPVKLQGKRQ